MQPAPDLAPRTAARARRPRTCAVGTSRKSARELEFFNGLGGFGAQGREYVIDAAGGADHSRAVDQRRSRTRRSDSRWQRGRRLHLGAQQPRERADALVNDPVANRPGEAIYLRDEETGELWTPTAGADPSRERALSVRARHGLQPFRTTLARHRARADACWCRSRTRSRSAGSRVRNDSPRRRSISVTRMSSGCWARRAPAARRTSSRSWTRSGALFARNPWNQPFPGVAFADLRGAQTEFTCDRREFLGRHGMLDAPAALVTGAPFSGRAGAGLDPCAALRTRIELEPGASTEIVFLLGEAASDGEARALIDALSQRRSRRGARRGRAHWDELIGHVQVEDARPRVRHHDESAGCSIRRWPAAPGRAPDSIRRAAPTVSAISCRTRWRWASRDPQLLREQILRAAARQFPEGDVQHWWLPHSGQGVRTHISDDRVWLAYVDRALRRSSPAIAPCSSARCRSSKAHRCRASGTMRSLSRSVSERDGDAVRALPPRSRRSLDMGQHGLPLIGTGDWNDGMNRVGEHGRGESVWLGWFLHATLDAFAPLRAGARRRSRWPPLARRRPTHCAPRSSNTLGMANGTAADSSTTARRSALRATTNAESTPSRNRGA